MMEPVTTILGIYWQLPCGCEVILQPGRWVIRCAHGLQLAPDTSKQAKQS